MAHCTSSTNWRRRSRKVLAAVWIKQVLDRKVLGAGPVGVSVSRDAVLQRQFRKYC